MPSLRGTLKSRLALLMIFTTWSCCESKGTTVVSEEYVLDSPQSEDMKEEPTPRCKLLTHSHLHRSSFGDEDQTLAGKWDVTTSPRSGDSHNFWSKDNEVENDDMSTGAGEMSDDKHHHDSFYDLINHKFWSPDATAWDRQRQQHEKQLEDNWKAWMKVLSFFPSGQQQVKKQAPPKSHNYVKTKAVNDDSSTLGQPLKHTSTAKVSQPKIENSIKDSPSPGVKRDDLNELDQQDPVKMLEPIPMHYEDQASQTPPPPVRETQQERPEVDRVVSDADSGWDTGSSTSLPTASTRVRNSLLKAADVARNLNLRALNSTTTLVPASTRPPYESDSSSRSSSDSNREFYSAEELVLSSMNDSVVTGGGDRRDTVEDDQVKPMFLGYGQVQRNDPFNGNGRAQARISCQFGDATSRNLTISNVEWARFTGQYDLEKQPPDFDCQSGSCRAEPVRTDISTTVHPRPAIQNYIDTLVPSYSVTLHEIRNDQLGVYRCSALRQSEGRTELVYRIILLE